MQSDYTSPHLEDAITKAMADKGISIKDMSEALDITYEHARRLSHGYPASRPILRSLCKLLDLDFDLMDKFSVEANIRRKFGPSFLKLAGKNPELEPIEVAWTYLTDSQKKDAITMIEGWAKRNKLVAIGG